MKYLFFLLLLSPVLKVSGQILKEQRVVLDDGSTLNYLTAQNKMNGLYSITKDKAELARGNYVDGKRVGNWYFFSYNKELAMRYNYDLGKLLFVDNKLLSSASVNIITDDDEVKAKASIPVPVLSLQQYYYLATAAAKQKINGVNLASIEKESVIVVAHINQDGGATYELRYVLKNGERKSATFDLGKEGFSLEWLPATYAGEKYDAEFSFRTELSTERKEDAHKRFNWM